MVNSILVVCVGNICRSPLGERLLRIRLESMRIAIESTGQGALTGQPADATAATVAASRGVSLQGHVARQFTPELGAAHDLILAMEPDHKREIARLAPQLSGRVMLFDQWTDATGITDPYRRSREYHEAVFDKVDAAATAWAERLAGAMKNRE